jgi:tRNA uridine 5-carboxymethylaminomethyl modification enzyme
MLREDNADLRLTETGYKLGLIDQHRWEAFARKRDAIDTEMERLRQTWVNPKTLAAADAERVLGKGIEREYSLVDLLRRPAVTYAELVSITSLASAGVDAEVAEQVEIQVKYQGYIDRQHDEVARQEHNESTQLPQDLDYREVHGLSVEVQQKLNQHKPETIGQASRIQGMTPAAISLLLVHLKRGMSKRSHKSAA